jgi:galactokinase
MTSYFDKVVKSFQDRFNHSPKLAAYAPGRVEVLGNHTDYNEGFVLSAAIDKGTYFLLSGREDKQVIVVSGNKKEEVTGDIDAFRKEGVSGNVVKDPKTWFNYIKGVLVQIIAKVPEAKASLLKGFEVFFEGDLPLGLGLSSSAALEISCGLVFSSYFDVKLTKHELAKIAQRSEHVYVGVKCGLLDQISSLYGEEARLVKTDFRSLEVETVPLGRDFVLLICDTKAHHSLVDSEYNERRENCEKSSAFFAKHLNHAVSHLRDVSTQELDTWEPQMDKTAAKRARHVIGENERVLKAKEFLQKGDFKQFGQLMFQSHDSSRFNFENSCPELDAMVESAHQISQGVYGARLSGGGFGGSVVVLVDRQHLDSVINQLSAKYLQKTGKTCDFYTILPSGGATLLLQ